MDEDHVAEVVQTELEYKTRQHKNHFLQHKLKYVTIQTGGMQLHQFMQVESLLKLSNKDILGYVYAGEKYILHTALSSG